MKQNFDKYMHKLQPDMTRSQIKCLGKQAHKTKKQALTAVSRVNKRAGIKLRVYKCPECRCYHLTRQLSSVL
jgi:hypothetical protein